MGTPAVLSSATGLCPPVTFVGSSGFGAGGSGAGSGSVCIDSAGSDTGVGSTGSGVAAFLALFVALFFGGSAGVVSAARLDRVLAMAVNLKDAIYNTATAEFLNEPPARDHSTFNLSYLTFHPYNLVANLAA